MDRRSAPGQTRWWKSFWLVAAVGQIAYAALRAGIGDSDLVGFHETALHLRQTGEVVSTFGWKYYLPGFAVLALPVLACPLWILAPAWAAVNVALLAWTARECSRLAGGPDDTAGFHLRWTLPLAGVLLYAADSIALGQFNLLVLALCVLAYSRFGRHGRDLPAGVLTGLAAVIKLFPLFLAGYWLATGRWRAALATLVTLVLVAGTASVAALGPRDALAAHRAWLAEVRGESYASPGTQIDGGREPPSVIFRHRANQWLRHNNQSLGAVIRRLMTDPGPEYREPGVNFVTLDVAAAWRLYLAAAGVVLAVLAAAAWRCRRSDADQRVYAAWLAGMIAFVPVYWTHYFVLALPGVTLLVREAWGAGGPSMRRSAARVLWWAWLAGQPLLAVRHLRLAGLQCALLLALLVWLLVWPRAVVGTDTAR